MTRERNFDLIENFQVGDINTISDHAYLQLRLKIVVANQHKNKDISDPAKLDQQNNEVPEFTNLKENYNCKYIPTANYKHRIKECLDSYEIKHELENLRSKIGNGDISNDGMIKVLRNICINISDKSFTKLKFVKTNKMSTKKTNFEEWFDDDCRKAKTNVNRKRKLYQEALKNKVTHNESKLRKDDYFQALNEFNAIKRRKARIHWREKKECLETMKMKIQKSFGGN